MRYGLGIGAVLCVGLLLRLDGLAERELWYDEVCTHYVVHHLSDWPADGPDLRREVAHRPYYFLLRVWTGLVGEEALGLRAFSVFAGCVGIAVLAGTARRIGGRSVGLIAAALAAVHPLHIYYSQEARVYTLWSLEAVLCLYVLYRAATSQQRRWWIAHGVVAWITVATHYYTMMWLPATVFAVFVASDRKGFLKQWFLTNVMLVIALVPLVIIFIMPLREGGPKLWLEETWTSYPPLLAIPRSLWTMLPSGGYPDYLGTLPVAFQSFPTAWGRLLAALAKWGPSFVVMMLMGIVSMRINRIRVRTGDDDRGEANESPPGGHPVQRHSGICTSGGEPMPQATSSVVPPWATSAAERHPNIRRPPRGAAATTEGPLYRGTTREDARDPTLAALLFLLTTTMGFLATAWLFSVLIRPVYMVGRYDFFVWPAVTMSVAFLIDAAVRGIGGRRPAMVAGKVVVTGVLVLCSGATIAASGSVAATNPTGKRAERLADRIEEGDLVVSLGMYRWFMSYEWLRQGFAPEVVSFPQRHARQLCWADARAELADRQELVEDVAFVVAGVGQALLKNRRVWLLAHGEPHGPRWEVDMMLYEGLLNSGFEIRPEDEWLGLARLVGKIPADDVPVGRGD